jgi:hypothetical protein
LGWSGGNFDSCQAGDISQAYRDKVLMRVNYYRQMAGVPLVQRFRDDYNQQAQAAAMVMSQYNTILRSDFPTSWTCITQPAKDGALYSNMVGDSNGPNAIDIYVRDFGDQSAGLRRYILYPQTREMGNGDVPAHVTSSTTHQAINALRIIDDNYFGSRPLTRDEFVAWPPAAYVPYTVAHAYWSFSYAKADFDHATVSVISGGKSIPVTAFKPNQLYGENTLVWLMDGWNTCPRPSADTAYTVSIHNVLINGQSRNFTYTVIVFDPGTSF